MTQAAPRSPTTGQSRMPDMPEPPPRYALWPILEYLVQAATWLMLGVLAIIVGQEAAIQMQNDQNTQLTSEMAGLKQNMADLTEQVTQQIQQLVEALALVGDANPTVQSALIDLRATNTELARVVNSLRADNPVVVPPNPDPQSPPVDQGGQGTDPNQAPTLAARRDSGTTPKNK